MQTWITKGWEIAATGGEQGQGSGREDGGRGVAVCVSGWVLCVVTGTSDGGMPCCC